MAMLEVISDFNSLCFQLCDKYKPNKDRVKGRKSLI